MSLQDIFEKNYGGSSPAAAEGAEKTAEEKAIETELAKFSEEECAKLTAAGAMLDSFGVEFKDYKEKLAAACNLVDEMSTEVIEEGTDGKGGEAAAPAATPTAADSEKLAAEYEAAGRIMARGLLDELSKTAATEENQSAAGSFRTKLGW